MHTCMKHRQRDPLMKQEAGPNQKKKAAHDAASFLNQILEFGTHLGLGEKQERTLTMSMTFGT